MTPARIAFGMLGIALAVATRAQPVVIQGGTVHTLGPDGTLEGVSVVIDRGKIQTVGKNIDVPDGAQVIDAEGKVVTPGLFDAYGHLGLVEVSLEPSTADQALASERYTASFRVAEAINPRSTLIPVNRIEGVTRAMAAPATRAYLPGGGEEKPWSLFAGQGAVFHLGGGPDPVMRATAAMFAALGETGASLAGGSRAAPLLRIREVLQDTRDFRYNRPDFRSGARYDYAASRLDLEALTEVLDRDQPLVVRVQRASDIRAALSMARELGIDLVIRGGAEAWRVADALAEANVPVILDPYQNLPSRFESLASRLDNAARLHVAGVTIAFSTGSSHNARNIKQGAGNAVAHGLPHDAALRALTVNPAKIYGVDGRYGRLVSGMVGDAVVWDGDPLEVTTFAERVVIDGRPIPMESRQTLLRDRYLQSDSRELPPAYAHPGRD